MYRGDRRCDIGCELRVELRACAHEALRFIDAIKTIGITYLFETADPDSEFTELR